MTNQTSYLEFENPPTPSEGFLVTHFDTSPAPWGRT